MKKAIIGAALMLSGVMIAMGVVIAGVLYVPSVTGWSGSRLWYSIQNMVLGLPLAIGVLLGTIGLIILILQYFSEQN